MATDLSPRGVLGLVHRNTDVYLKTWKTNFLPPLLEPLLYTLALGYGVGAFIDEIGGVSYARFIAPGILAITMMQSAFFETTYGSYIRMYFQKTWDALTATPLSLDDVIVGELVWAALKSTVNTFLMSLVLTALGLLPWWSVPLFLPLAFATGLVFGGMGMMFSAKVQHIDGFQFGIYLLVTPMMLFAGTYFPLDQMPAAAQAAAQVLPLTHAVAIARAVALGTGTQWALHLGYLAVAAVVFPAVSLAWMKRRLVV
jgi:lipooligosaccharide transport system permease protein